MGVSGNLAIRSVFWQREQGGRPPAAAVQEDAEGLDLDRMLELRADTIEAQQRAAAGLAAQVMAAAVQQLAECRQLWPGGLIPPPAWRQLSKPGGCTCCTSASRSWRRWYGYRGTRKMRDGLAPFVGQRHRFAATIDRIGVKDGWRSAITVLLKAVELADFSTPAVTILITESI